MLIIVLLTCIMSFIGLILINFEGYYFLMENNKYKQKWINI